MEKGVEWCFTPPGASHMGGIWERMIRTICKLLAALFDPYSRLTDEILETLMCEIEMIINSRPLTKISEDIKDMTAITPNHLLMLREGPTLAPGVFTSGDIYQKRWRNVQHLADRFWKQWLKAYLPELQKRTKWFFQKRNVMIGDLVLISDENTPRYLWPLAIVTETNKGRDGLVRSVKLRTRSKELVRPITKIVFLESVVS